ncbi:MAG: NAD(P)-dependent oxidoreductase [Magnetococcales bacterium]|nr:NAD(P)-dependent oxidoreductase [Magnetococcales bacterium]
MMVKAIVFGGSGFLGSHVADSLSERGYEVSIFDIADSKYRRDDQEMIIGDILNPDQVNKAVKGKDYIYNFAGLASLDDASTKPLRTVSLNIVGAINIMEAAIMARIKRLVYASSIYVYSQKGGFYRCSKQAAELYIEEYGRCFGMEFTVVRFGTLYGPRADAQNSIRRYLKQAIDSGEIKCQGSGEEMREYIFVRDAAELSVDILDDRYINQHIILTGHQSVKFKDMLLTIQEILGRDIRLEFSGQSKGDHYSHTPYSFIPKIGNKLVSNYYLDIGQGLLECLKEMHGDTVR